MAMTTINYDISTVAHRDDLAKSEHKQVMQLPDPLGMYGIPMACIDFTDANACLFCAKDLQTESEQGYGLFLSHKQFVSLNKLIYEFLQWAPEGSEFTDSSLFNKFIHEHFKIKNPQETTDMATTEKTDNKQPSAAMEKIKAVGKTAIAQTKEDAEFVLVHGSAQQLLEAMSDAAAVLASDDPKVIEFLQYERIQATRAVLQSNGTRVVFLPGGTMPNMLMNTPQ